MVKISTDTSTTDNKLFVVINPLEQVKCPGATQETFNIFFKKKIEYFYCMIGQIRTSYSQETFKVGI